ncbi:MAG: DinB family protein, partial [Vicinamibacterales bacterium]
MSNTSQPEVWLRGPIAGIPALLQPVAHSLIQCREELTANVAGLTPEQIWTQPSGAASIGFHIRHAAGSLDRLFTYARGEQLSAAQRAALSGEAHPDIAPNVGARLLTAFDETVGLALEQLNRTNEATLLDVRTVGRAQLPSTVLGLLFHAAEHTQRHAGQVATTVKVVSPPDTG